MGLLSISAQTWYCLPEAGAGRLLISRYTSCFIVSQYTVAYEEGETSIPFFEAIFTAGFCCRSSISFFISFISACAVSYFFLVLLFFDVRVIVQYTLTASSITEAARIQFHC